VGSFKTNITSTNILLLFTISEQKSRAGRNGERGNLEIDMEATHRYRLILSGTPETPHIS